jgi:hypothetical protein
MLEHHVMASEMDEAEEVFNENTARRRSLTFAESDSRRE